MKTIFIFLSILMEMLTNTYQAPIVHKACRRLPYDFYHIPGTRDFFFLRYEYMTFSNAREYCISQGMDLPSILNQQQNSLIHSFIKHSKYSRYHTIGISPLNNVNNNMWLNGDNFSFRNFKQNMSIDILNMHIQIASDTGQWELHSCDLKAGIVCHARC